MEFLTVREIAKILRAKPSTIYAWAEQGLIPCFKFNGLLRFSEDDIMAWIKSNYKKSAEEYNNPTSRRPRKGGQS